MLGPEITDCPQEGPNVFEFAGNKWLISDYWHGLAVYRSDDFAHWKRCSDILDVSGTRTLDQGFGHHADIVVRDDRAFIFYFCHPFAGEKGCGAEDNTRNFTVKERRMAAVQAAELFIKDGELACDRNARLSWAGRPAPSAGCLPR